MKKQFYYVSRYSFDPDRPVTGPFGTKQIAWNSMLETAMEEHESDLDTYKDADICLDMSTGEIKLLVINSEGVEDVTEFFIIEVPTGA